LVTWLLCTDAIGFPKEKTVLKLPFRAVPSQRKIKANNMKLKRKRRKKQNVSMEKKGGAPMEPFCNNCIDEAAPPSKLKKTWVLSVEKNHTVRNSFAMTPERPVSPQPLNSKGGCRK
jgi:hypothetical protein